jgi:hypothetical protein
MFYREDPKTQQEKSSRQPTETETQYSANPTCFEVHEKWCVGCDKTDCRNWINYEEDLNCAVVCSRKYDNGLSLREVADRMNVSFPRISQIEHAAFKKLQTLGALEDFE